MGQLTKLEVKREKLQLTTKDMQRSINCSEHLKPLKSTHSLSCHKTLKDSQARLHWYKTQQTLTKQNYFSASWWTQISSKSIYLPPNASKLNSQHIRKTTHHDHIRFMPRSKGWLNTRKLINMIQQEYKQIITLIETKIIL